MAVRFTNSGSINFGNLEGISTTSGMLLFFNEETSTVVSSTLLTYSGSTPVPYTLDNLHTSKDNYYVGFADRGRVGECRFCEGLAPTVPIYIERFTGPYITS